MVVDFFEFNCSAFYFKKNIFLLLLSHGEKPTPVTLHTSRIYFFELYDFSAFTVIIQVWSRDL